jgi:hypothetical protein
MGEKGVVRKTSRPGEVLLCNSLGVYFGHLFKQSVKRRKGTRRRFEHGT